MPPAREMPALREASAIIAPDLRYVVEPVFGKEDLITAEIELDRVVEEKLTPDFAGHYARPDLFELRVNQRELRPVEPASDD